MKIITEKCLSCGSCEELCPNEAIIPSEVTGRYVGMKIDSDKCCNCYICLNEADCPGDAIIED